MEITNPVGGMRADGKSAGFAPSATIFN